MRDLNDLKLKGKKYIIFDMDGTLIDSVGVWNRTDQILIERYGGKTIDLDFIQNDREEFLRDHQSSNIYLEYCRYLIKKYSLNITDSQGLLDIRNTVSKETLKNEIDFKPDVVELIRILRENGFILVLATMTTQVQLDIYSKENSKMLNQMNIYDAFDYVTSSDDVKKKKPDPEIYLAIMKKYGADVSECLVFEDSYTGVLASRKAGIEVVNVYDEYADGERDEIDKITDYRISNYREFIDFIENLYGLHLLKKGKRRI